MVTKLDLETWVRRPHFENFRTYGDPFFNITAEVDVTDLVQCTRDHKVGFFAASYFLVLKVANEIDEFRYRIRENDVVVHDVIHGSCTVLNDDESFSFCIFPFHGEFSHFDTEVSRVLSENKEAPQVAPLFNRDDLVHSSIIPWLRFSSFEHAKPLGIGDSCPKVVLGKFIETSGRFSMPISVSGHHGLMDGLHASFFFSKYESYAANSDGILRTSQSAGC